MSCVNKPFSVRDVLASCSLSGLNKYYNLLSENLKKKEKKLVKRLIHLHAVECIKSHSLKKTLQSGQETYIHKQCVFIVYRLFQNRQIFLMIATQSDLR